MASFDDFSAEESRALEEWARGAPLSPALQSRYRQMQVLSVYSMNEIHKAVPCSNKYPRDTYKFAGTSSPLRNPHPDWRERRAGARLGLLQQALWTHARQNQQRRDLQRVLDEARGTAPAALQPVDDNSADGVAPLLQLDTLEEVAAAEVKPPVWPIDDLWAEYKHPPVLELLEDTSPPGDGLPPLFDSLGLVPLPEESLYTTATDTAASGFVEDTSHRGDSLPSLLQLLEDDGISTEAIDTVGLQSVEHTSSTGDSLPTLFELLESVALEDDSLCTKATDTTTLEPKQDTSTSDDSLPPSFDLLELAPLDDNGLSASATDTAASGFVEDTSSTGNSLPPFSSFWSSGHWRATVYAPKP